MSVEGTITSTVGSPQTLAAFTASEKASWTLYFDAANMQTGDTIKLTIALQVISGGAERIVTTDTIAFEDIMDNDSTLVTIPVVLEEGYTLSATLEQTLGSTRNYDWRLADVPFSS